MLDVLINALHLPYSLETRSSLEPGDTAIFLSLLLPLSSMLGLQGLGQAQLFFFKGLLMQFLEIKN